jgi:hypothetical protein
MNNFIINFKFDRDDNDDDDDDDIYLQLTKRTMTCWWREKTLNEKDQRDTRHTESSDTIFRVATGF